MAFYNLLSKCDRAIAAYLISAGAGTDDDIFHMKRAGDLPNPPFTTVYSSDASEAVPFSGAYKVKVSVDVHTNAAPDKDQETETMRIDSDDRVAATFDALHDLYVQCGDKLADLITAAAAGAGITDFTVDDVLNAGIEQARAEKDGEFVDTINLEILCRAS